MPEWLPRQCLIVHLVTAVHCYFPPHSGSINGLFAIFWRIAKGYGSAEARTVQQVTCLNQGKLVHNYCASDVNRRPMMFLSLLPTRERFAEVGSYVRFVKLTASWKTQRDRKEPAFAFPATGKP